MKRPLTILCFVVSTACFCPYAPAQDSQSGSSVIAKLDLILKRIETIEKRLAKLEVALVGAPAAGQLSEKLPGVNESVRVITDKTAGDPRAKLKAAVRKGTRYTVEIELLSHALLLDDQRFRVIDKDTIEAIDKNGNFDRWVH